MNHTHRLPSTWVILTLLLSLAVSTAFAEGNGEARKRRPRTVLYQVKADASAAELAALNAVVKKHQLKSVKKLRGGQVQLAASQAAAVPSEEALAKELRASGGAAFAEPDYYVAPNLVPDDPGYGSQWHHATINSPGAWDTTTGSSSVIVAVVDTGVESTHPDLAANLKLPGLNTVDNTTNTEPVGSHGTMVAGLVGAVGNNGTGVSGVAWNIKILPVRISNVSSGFAYYSDMYEGITWAADQGAKVVNLSYVAASSPTIDSAAQYLRNKGGLLLVCAGNDGVNGDGTYPDFTSFVAVGATDSTDTKTSWSNYGNFIDIVAPGINMRSTYTGGSYATGYGTSFSTPVAAGLAALIWSINPGFTPAQVEGFIFNTCKDLGAAGNDSVYGHGRIDAAAAVQMAQAFVGNLAPSIDSAPWANPNSIVIGNTTTVNVIASDPDSGPSALTYTWSKVSGPGTVGFSPNGSTGAASSTASFSAAGAYIVRVTVSDGVDMVSGDTDVLVTDPNVINAPSNLTGSASGNTVTLNWTDNSGNETVFQIDRGVKVRKNTTWTSNVASVGANVTMFSENVANGTYLYRVRAVNSSTGKVSANSNEVQVKVGTTGGGKGKSR